MVEQELFKKIDSITPTSKVYYQKAQERLDSLVKPPGSLGELEEIAKKLWSITETEYPDISKRSVIIMASDNGVVDEGVASADQAVTLMQTINFTKGITGVAVLAKSFNSDLMVVDVGINSDKQYPGIIDKKIRKSTGNIATHHAMTRAQAVDAISVGISAVEQAVLQGNKLIGVGEMGIGNTTTSSAVLSALLELSCEEIQTAVGRGAGLSDDGYAKKINIIQQALDTHKPNKDDLIDILSKVGGLDIAAMCGVYLGASLYKVPVVIDGFISMVAALCAYKLNPLSKEYMFASHHSYERGYTVAAQALDINAPLNLNMRLGEGSGCPLMFSIMDGACSIIKNMGTFDEASIDSSYLEGIDSNTAF